MEPFIIKTMIDNFIFHKLDFSQFSIFILMANPEQLTSEPSFFGKYQRYVTIAVLICYQMLGVPWASYIFYLLFTLNWKMLSFIVLISVVQSPIRKSETFIRLVKKYIQPTKYFNKFTRITEEKIDPN
jgi:hypothetical protein